MLLECRITVLRHEQHCGLSVPLRRRTSAVALADNARRLLSLLPVSPACRWFVAPLPACPLPSRQQGKPAHRTRCVWLFSLLRSCTLTCQRETGRQPASVVALASKDPIAVKSCPHLGADDIVLWFSAWLSMCPFIKQCGSLLRTTLSSIL